MPAFNNCEFEKYNAEVKEKWGRTAAYKEYEEKTANCSDQKQNNIAEGMDHIMKDFSFCMKKDEHPDSAEAQNLVKTLQNYISENYYHCTKTILSGLGQMYVEDERFRNNIDKHADGTAVFIREAISVYCK